MEGQTGNDIQLFKLIVYAAIAIAIGYAVVMMVLVLACMLAVAGIGGAGYWGYRLAVEPTVWQLRKAHEAARRKEEWKLHKATAPSEIHELVDSFCLEQAEKPYRPKTIPVVVDDVLDTTKKVISTFRRKER
jgi:hypothetical protein